MIADGIITLLIATTALSQLASGDLDFSLPEATLESEAVFIGSVTSRDISQTLIPGIGFRCSGNLNRWTVVGSKVGGGLHSPELQVWRPTGQGLDYTKESGTRVHPSSNSPAPHVYEVELSSPFSFREGDILGLFTPATPSITLKFQKRGGPLNYWSTPGLSPRSSYSLNGAGVLANRIDVPLVSIEATPSHCVTGFVELPTLLLKASLLTVNDSDLRYREATQRIIPEARFPDNGFVESLKVGALRRTGSRYPEIQIWRTAGSNVWNRVASIGSQAAISSTGDLNVHEYRPFAPIPVLEGDIIGIHQPYTSACALQVFYQDHGPLNYYQPALANPKNTLSTGSTLVQRENRQPLLAIEFRAERATTPTILILSSTQNNNNIKSTEFPWIRPSTSTSLRMRPSATTSSWIHPSNSPSAVPGVHHSSHFLVVIVGVTVALLVLLVAAGGLATVIGLIRCKRYQTQTLNRQSSPNVAATNKCVDLEGSMQYNVNYRPTDPRHVISNGKKQQVDLRINRAYDEHPKDKEHIYESLD